MRMSAQVNHAVGDRPRFFHPFHHVQICYQGATIGVLGSVIRAARLRQKTDEEIICFIISIVTCSELCICSQCRSSSHRVIPHQPTCTVMLPTQGAAGSPLQHVYTKIITT
jgi:hypothetical protein